MVPLYPIAVLLAGAALSVAIGRAGLKRGLGKAPAIIAVASMLVSALMLCWISLTPACWSRYPVMTPIGSELKVDAFSAIFSVTFIIVALSVAVYSWSYVDDGGAPEYYALLLTLTAGMIGVVLSNDFFTLYMFWELMCISSYSMVAFNANTPESVEAGFKYLVISTVGSLVALIAIVTLAGLTGTLSFSVLEKTLSLPHRYSYFLAMLAIAGFGVTAALVPFHTWLPDAYCGAPLPYAAVSSAVIKTGIYAISWAIFRILSSSLPGSGEVLMLIGLLTMTFANAMVIGQEGVRRFLAYSSVANMGYIAMGVGLSAYLEATGSSSAAVVAMCGALIHALNHAVGKALAFMSIGCVLREVGTDAIEELERVGCRSRLAAAGFSMGLLNLAGIPPLGGFWGKFFMLMALMSKPGDPLLCITTVVFVSNCVFAAAYYLWLMNRVVISRLGEKSGANVPLSMGIPVVALSLACVLITLFLPAILDYVNRAALCLLGV